MASAPFQKSWSMHGLKRNGLNFGNRSFNRQEPIFRSGRLTRTNLQNRFGFSPLEEHHYENINPVPPPSLEEPSTSTQDENDCPFYLKPQPGMKFRSLTDTNIRRFEVNGVAKSHNEMGSSEKPRFRHQFRQIPKRIGPILNNIQNTMGKAGPKTEKFIAKGGKKVQRAFGEVCTSINSWSQRLRKSTNKMYNLDNEHLTTPTRSPYGTPHRGNRVTPGKLYSPFDLNTPRTPYSHGKGPKRLQHGPSKRSIFGNDNMGLCRTPQSRSKACNFHNWTRFESPSSHFHQSSFNTWREPANFSPFTERPTWVNFPSRL